MFITMFLMAVLSEEALVLQLGDDDFIVREEASCALQMRMNFQMYVRFRNARHEDAEIQYRLKTLAQNFERKIIGEYRVNFRGAKMYPSIDHIFRDGYKLDDAPWWMWDENDFVQNYLELADHLGAVRDGPPKWTNYRFATQLFIQDRINYVAFPAIRDATNETEFRTAMKKGMEPIQKDFDRFIEREVAFYSVSEEALNFFFGLAKQVQGAENP